MSNFTTWRSLVDGEEILAIPDSVVSHFDAREENVGTLSSFTDQVGNYDLSGSAEVISDGINGQETVRLDGSEIMSNDSIQINQPHVIVAVFQQQSNSSEDHIFDSTSSSGRRMFRDDGGDYSIFFGDSGVTGGSPDTDHHVVVIEARSGEDRVEIDGDVIIDGESGDDDMEGFTIGADRNEEDRAEVDFGEIMHLEDPSDSDISDQRDRMADDWGISLD